MEYIILKNEVPINSTKDKMFKPHGNHTKSLQGKVGYIHVISNFNVFIIIVNKESSKHLSKTFLGFQVVQIVNYCKVVIFGYWPLPINLHNFERKKMISFNGIHISSLQYWKLNYKLFSIY